MSSRGDQVLVVDAVDRVQDNGAARRGMRRLHGEHLVLDDAEQPRARMQDFQVLGDLGRELVQRLGDLVASERGEALQAQLQYTARLRLGQAVQAVRVERRARVGDERDERRHVLGGPSTGHQRLAGGGRVGRGADEPDHLVDVGHRDGKADLEVGGVPRLGQQELGASGDDLLAEVDEGDQDVAQRHELAAGRHSGRSCCSRKTTAWR